MPEPETRGNNSRTRVQPERNSRQSFDQTAEPNRSTGEEGLSHLPDDLLGRDFSLGTFEHHAQLLSDPRMSHPTGATEKAGIFRRLQRDYGNRYVQRLINHISRKQEESVQTKLTVGPAGDKYEQEADSVAKQVISMTGPSVQKEGGPAEEELQMKPLVQRQVPLEGGEVDLGVEQSIQQAQGGGQALPDSLRTSMEGAFGADFGRVRVHTGTESDALNESLNARAFTTGQDIFFGQGEFDPGSSSGKEILAHELTHVVQQGSASVQSGSDVNPVASEESLRGSPSLRARGIGRRDLE